MAKLHEIFIGARFGKLTVTGPRIPGGQARVPVRCDCGAEKIVYVHHLGDRTCSCGCGIREAGLVHGMSSTPEYKAWDCLIQRCTNPNTPGWHRYGGRGISVHPDFRASFEAFLKEVGPRPSAGHSIDRIDNDRGYEPGNLRWATAKQQTLNRTVSRICPSGHLKEGSNLLVTSSGVRRCRECYRLASQRYQARRKARELEAGQ